MSLFGDYDHYESMVRMIREDAVLDEDTATEEDDYDDWSAEDYEEYDSYIRIDG